MWTPEFILEKWKWDNQQNKQVREVHSSSEDLTLGSASSRTGQTVSRTSSVMFLSRTQEPGTPRVYLMYLFDHDHRDYWAFTVPLNTVHCKSLIKTTSPCEFSANHSSALAGQQMLMDRCPASWSTLMAASGDGRHLCPSCDNTDLDCCLRPDQGHKGRPSVWNVREFRSQKAPQDFCVVRIGAQGWFHDP